MKELVPLVEGVITVLLPFQVRSYPGVVNVRRVEVGPRAKWWTWNIIIDGGYVDLKKGDDERLASRWSEIWTARVGDVQDFLPYYGGLDAVILFDPGIVLHRDELALLEKYSAIKVAWKERGYFAMKHKLSTWP